jgi:hypothetical protein
MSRRGSINTRARFALRKLGIRKVGRVAVQWRLAEFENIRVTAFQLGQRTRTDRKSAAKFIALMIPIEFFTG